MVRYLACPPIATDRLSRLDDGRVELRLRPWCDGTTAFFSGDDTVGWESAFNLAGTVLVSDKKKKVDTLVLLTEEPVAGRAVTLGKH